MEQQVRFCTTSDGVRIAYATVGKGAPLVEVSGWVSHLQFEWSQPEARAFWEGLAQGRLLARYDMRGTGLSDWDVDDFSIESRLRDLEAVVDALGLERFALIGASEGGPTALVYAARHPERVSRLVLCGSYHRWPYPREDLEPLLALVRAQWGMGSADLAAAFLRSSYPARVASFMEAQRISAEAATAAKILEANVGLDVTPMLREIRAPSLILHHVGDSLAPVSLAREMADLIPGARVELFQGAGRPSWVESKAIAAAIDAFLLEDKAQTRREPRRLRGPLTILFTDMEGSTPLTQRLGDDKAQALLRTHNAIIRDALEAHGGLEIKHTGDGIMASFSSPSQGMECAIAIQRALASHNESNPDTPIRVRVGLNAGEPVAEDDDLFGTAVQLAARACARAEPGQILASDVVHGLVAGKRFLFADRGEVALRGFDAPVRLYEVRWAG